MRTGDLSDPRAQRTRSLLLAEFERQLAVEGGFPTVASLVRAAGVSRGAFYCHFSSIEELGVAAVRASLEDLGERDVVMRRDNDCTGKQVTRLTCGAFFAHIAAHRILYAMLVATSQDGSAREELREALIRQTQRSIGVVSALPTGISSRRAAAYMVGGLLGVLSEWLHDPHPCDPHELAESIADLMPQWFVSDGHTLPSIEVASTAPPTYSS